MFLRKLPGVTSAGRRSTPASTIARRALRSAAASRERSEAGAARRGGSSASPLPSTGLYAAISHAASFFALDSRTMHLKIINMKLYIRRIRNKIYVHYILLFLFLFYNNDVI